MQKVREFTEAQSQVETTGQILIENSSEKRFHFISNGVIELTLLSFGMKIKQTEIQSLI